MAVVIAFVSTILAIIAFDIALNNYMAIKTYDSMRFEYLMTLEEMRTRYQESLSTVVKNYTDSLSDMSKQYTESIATLNGIKEEEDENR